MGVRFSWIFLVLWRQSCFTRGFSCRRLLRIHGCRFFPLSLFLLANISSAVQTRHSSTQPRPTIRMTPQVPMQQNIIPHLKAESTICTRALSPIILLIRENYLTSKNRYHTTGRLSGNLDAPRGLYLLNSSRYGIDPKVSHSSLTPCNPTPTNMSPGHHQILSRSLGSIGLLQLHRNRRPQRYCLLR
jgi:ribosomal protein L33